jgi:ASC-1-like (ASCH) protein
MEVQEPWLSMIEDGTKTVEGRSGPRSKFIHLIGHLVELYYQDRAIIRLVVDIRHYDTLDQYLAQEWRCAAPTAQSIDDARQKYLEIRTADDEQVYSAERLQRVGGMNGIVLE